MESSKIIAHISVLRSSYHKPVANTKKRVYILYTIQSRLMLLYSFFLYFWCCYYPA
jgi:hypothetical protein